MKKFKESASKKANRYAKELKRKRKSNGKALTGKTVSYRMGYSNARRDRSRANILYKKSRKR